MSATFVPPAPAAPATVKALHSAWVEKVHAVEAHEIECVGGCDTCADVQEARDVAYAAMWWADRPEESDDDYLWIND